jgi:outer membrane receptor protein involved in Fe transport
VQLTAGVSGGSNPNVGGASSNENTYMLDGVNITDPVTGTFSLNFNFDSIEQVEVITDAFDPEYGVNLGGVVNIVTQTGSNNFKFRSGMYHRNGSWSPKQDWRFASDGTTLAPSDFGSRYETYLVGGQISGPIVKDKAWFIASYQMTRSLIAESGVPVPRDFDGHYVFGKLTFQPTSDHRFTVLAQTNPSTIDNTYFGGRFIKPEAQGRQAQGGFVTSLQWDWFVSPTVFLETKTLLQKTYLEGYAVACTHDKDLGYHPCEPDELENNIDFFTPGRIGTFNAYDSDNEIRYDFDDRWRASLQSKFSVLQVDFLGTHDFKAGMESEVLVWNRTFGVNGNLIFYDRNESPYNPDTLQNYYWVEYSGPFSFVSTATQTGLFIQDVWKPVDNLTFRYGTRYDWQVYRNDIG